MKTKISTVAIICLLGLVTCNSNRQPHNAPRVTQAVYIEPVSTAVDPPSIVGDYVMTTVTDNKGNILQIFFNNANGTGMIPVNNDTIYMVRDTTASGIRMYNDEYEYVEWQGYIQLKRNGSVVFTNQ